MTRFVSTQATGRSPRPSGEPETTTIGMLRLRIAYANVSAGSALAVAKHALRDQADRCVARVTARTSSNDVDDLVAQRGAPEANSDRDLGHCRLTETVRRCSTAMEWSAALPAARGPHSGCVVIPHPDLSNSRDGHGQAGNCDWPPLARTSNSKECGHRRSLARTRDFSRIPLASSPNILKNRRIYTSNLRVPAARGLRSHLVLRVAPG